MSAYLDEAEEGIDGVTEMQPSHSSDAGGDGVTLRLLWPQWQGAGTSSVQALAPEFPFHVARRGYAVGSTVLAAVLPANQGPTAAAPVAMDDSGLELADGIEAEQVILTQLAQALEVIHAMAVAALTGHGDREVQELLPAIVSPDRVALVGPHAWANDDIANVGDWGIRAFSPDDLRETTQPLVDWLAATGCSRVAIHFDVDTIDGNELVLGLGAEPGGLTTARCGASSTTSPPAPMSSGSRSPSSSPARSCTSSSS